MLRKVIRIDEGRCNGCGLCADACHEGAIAIIEGKARLLRDDYCDGLGDCLPTCPMDAISFETREATPYDEDAVRIHKQMAAALSDAKSSCGCPSSAEQSFGHAAVTADEPASSSDTSSALTHWPVQMRLMSPASSSFDGVDLLVAADCTAFSCGDFHTRFMQGRTVIIGCPKLDPVDYTDELAAIVSSHDIRSITVVLMEVPCCSGLGNAVRTAIERSGRDIPLVIETVSCDGTMLPSRF